MKAGFSKICINPPLGTPMVGYYEERRARGIHDDIFVKAAAFDDGRERAVILTVDVCLLSGTQCNAFRERVAKSSGVKKAAIFINCSHTHTGPTIGYDKISGLDGNAEYDAFFEEALCRATNEALADLQEATFSFAEGRAEGIAFARRFRMKDGSVRTNPGINNPDTLAPIGTPNEVVKLIRVDRESGKSMVFVNYGLHADTVGGELISGDWPNVVCSTVEKVLDDTVCFFLLGSQGDVAHVNVNPTTGERRGLDYDSFDGVPRGYEYTLHMGRTVAGAAIGIYGTAEPFTADSLSFGSKEIFIPANQENERLEEAKKIKELYEAGRASELPYEDMALTTVVAEAVRICELADGPEGFTFTLSALKLGDFVLAGMPGECFTEIGRRIEADYDGGHMMVCCLTNGGDSYFPTSSAYDEGGYETATSRLKKGGDNTIVDGVAALIKELK